MSIDDRGRRAANEMRNSRRDARFTVRSPSQGGGPSLWPILGVAVVAIVALIGLTQLLGNGDEEVVDTTGVETTIPPTTIPSTTELPSTTAPTTTQPPTTTAPTTTQPTVEIPERALAFSGSDLVSVDTASGDTEVIQQSMFEAAYPSRLALSPDGERAYYQLYQEDSWFSCEFVSGEVVMVNVQSGSSTTIGRGLPALSPNGTRLAYLTSDGCFPDPAQPEFFIAVFDTLVVTDADGTDQVRFGLEGEVGTPGSPALENLVWADSETILVLAESGTTYRIPVDTSTSEVITDHETVDLPPHHLLAVVDGVGIGATRQAAALWGPLETVNMATGAAAPLPAIPETGFEHHVGVSADNAVIVGFSQGEGGTLAVIDPATGETTQTFNLPGTPGGVDW